jgi:hypothetical protein
MGWFVMNPSQDETDIYLIDNGCRSGPGSGGGKVVWLQKRTRRWEMLSKLTGKKKRKEKKIGPLASFQE